MAEARITKRASALEITQRLQAHGFQAFWAGGCVRDQLLGIEPKDYDIATNAKPDEIRKLFPNSQLVGAAFGVIIVHRHHYATEIATFRTDGVYRDGRRPESVEFTTAEVDAQRRDFTINGMFFDPIREQVIDYVGGKADIAAKLIRAIGDADARFSEDHLRMMRAVRFAARFHFQIELQTSAAIRHRHEKIKLISRERIGQELKGVLATPNPMRGVELLADTRLLGDIWPETLAGDDHQSTLQHGWLQRLPAGAKFELYLTAMVHDLSPDAANRPSFWPTLQSQFMLSNEEIKAVSWIWDRMRELENWRALRLSRIKRIMADERFDLLRELYQAVHPADNIRDCWTLLAREGVNPQPLITGEDLIQLGAKPGPEFKRWLDELYDLQLENHFPGRAEALAAAKGLIGQGSSGPTGPR